jgi:hypothetical protein
VIVDLEKITGKIAMASRWRNGSNAVLAAVSKCSIREETVRRQPRDRRESIITIQLPLMIEDSPLCSVFT